jgi:methionyl-tRNA formyltransferase
MSASGRLCVVAAYHGIGHVGLETILRHGWEVALVYTHRDEPNETIWWNRVADLAEQHGIPVEFADINEPAQRERLKQLDPDYLFSIYYRKLIRKDILDLFPAGAYNLHGSLLPLYRGRAPLNWVLVNGEIETGVTLHHMVEKADAGDIVDQEWVPIEDDESAMSLYNKLMEATVNTFDRCLSWFERGKAPRIPQDLAKGSYFGARKPEDGRIDFSWHARRCFNLVRAVTKPWPGAFAEAGQHRTMIWWAKPLTSLKSGRKAPPGTVLIENGIPVVACGEGFLQLEKVSPPGQGEIEGAQAAASGAIPEGMQFFAS